MVAWAGEGKQGPGRAGPENVGGAQCGRFELWLLLTIACETELSHDPSESQFLQFKSEAPSHRLCKALNTHREHSRLRKFSELSSSCSVHLSQ